VLQPLVELDVYGRADPERGVGAGLSTMETGLRLRYAFRREFAPYVGMVWHRAFGKTADLNKMRGERAGTVRLLGGVRMWF
jgi:copper resistance protein B